MSYIYRVENKKEEGCYYGKHYDSKIRQVIGKHFSPMYNKKYPEPVKDKGIARHMAWKEICGFLNKKQALNWFTKRELLGLEKLGYILKKIEVKEITAIGKKQVLAIK